MSNVSLAVRPVPASAVEHRREHRGLTADAERRLLVWIARRLPSWVTSNMLSGIGLAGMLLAGAGFALMRRSSAGAWVVIVALAINWFGDSLDGTLARVRNQQRPRFGLYVDHVIDLAGATFLFAGLALSGLMAPLLAAGLLVAFLLVCAETYLATCVSSVFKLSFLRFGPTELRIVLAAGAIKVMTDPYVDVAVLGRLRLFDIGGVIAAAGLLLAFVVSAARQIRLLHQVEPLPVRR